MSSVCPHTWVGTNELTCRSSSSAGRLLSSQTLFDANDKLSQSFLSLFEGLLLWGLGLFRHGRLLPLLPRLLTVFDGFHYFVCYIAHRFLNKKQKRHLFSEVNILMLGSFPHNNNSETCNLKARDRKERLSWWWVLEYLPIQQYTSIPTLSIDASWLSPSSVKKLPRTMKPEEVIVLVSVL